MPAAAETAVGAVQEFITHNALRPAVIRIFETTALGRRAAETLARRRFRREEDSLIFAFHAWARIGGISNARQIQLATICDPPMARFAGLSLGSKPMPRTREVLRLKRRSRTGSRLLYRQRACLLWPFTRRSTTAPPFDVT